MSALAEGSSMGITYDDDDEPMSSLGNAPQEPAPSIPAPAAAQAAAPASTASLSGTSQVSEDQTMDASGNPVVPASEQILVDGETPSASSSRRPAPVNHFMLVVLVLMLIGGVVFFSQKSAPVPESVEALSAIPADPNVSSDVQGVLAEDLIRARAFADETGSFRGFSPTAPVIGAAGTEALVLVFSTPEGCFFTGIAPGFDEAIKSDPTGVNCTPEALAVVQAELDTAETADEAALSTAARDSANTRMTSAVEVAQFWASNNFVDGTPSFSGLEGYTLVDGVEVLAVTDGGRGLVASTSLDGSNLCLQANISSSGANFFEAPC